MTTYEINKLHSKRIMKRAKQTKDRNKSDKTIHEVFWVSPHVAGKNAAVTQKGVGGGQLKTARLKYKSQQRQNTAEKTARWK